MLHCKQNLKDRVLLSNRQIGNLLYITRPDGVVSIQLSSVFSREYKHLTKVINHKDITLNVDTSSSLRLKVEKDVKMMLPIQKATVKAQGCHFTLR